MNLSNQEIILLAKYCQQENHGETKKITRVFRNSEKEFDLEIHGKVYTKNGYFVGFFTAWLPLNALYWLAGQKLAPDNKDEIWKSFEKWVKDV